MLFLSEIEFANGILSSIFVVISISIGVMMILRYFKYKTVNLILAGITWMIICEPWWAVSISFLSTILTGNPLPIEIFFLIGFPLIPLGIMAWMLLMTNLLYKDKKQQILIIFGIFSATFEILFFVFFFVDITILGVPAGVFDVDYAPFMLLYIVFILLIVLFAGTRFGLESLKSSNPEIKLKGKFLLLAFYSFVIGSFVSVLSAGVLVVLIVAKIIVIMSSIEFYFGFVLPKPIKKLFLKNE